MSKVLVTDYTFDSLETDRAILEPIGIDRSTLRNTDVPVNP